MTLTERKLVTVLTDFGDFYPGIMKGNILKSLESMKIDVNVEIIDITHSINPQDIYEGAFLLLNSYRFFPPAIHIAVVDPGVGGKRDSLIVECQEHTFIGPDNGLLYPASQKAGVKRLWKIDESKFNNVSSTFHGRDIFAPSTAFVIADKIPEIASEIKDMGGFKELELFDYRLSEDGAEVECRILFIDKFGNAVTNLKREIVEKLNPKSFYISERKFPLVEYYSEVEKGSPLSLIGSFGTLEFGLREGNFSKKYGIGNGLLEFRFE